MNDQLDVSVHDSDVLAEIEMMTNLIIATSEAEGPLPQVRIDEILGVAPHIPRARLASRVDLSAEGYANRTGTP